MSELFNSFYIFIMNTIDALGVYGPLLGSLFIILESIIPPLPLFVFITINFVAFGKVLGFIISWICTCIGCILSYYLVKKLFRNWVVNKIKDVNLLTKCMNYVENLSLTQVTMILSIPFTPAFMVNIAAGLCNMNFKKFLTAILISKIFLVYFWGVVGTGLLESFHNPTSLITVVVMIVIAYILSIVIKKVFKID
ncbi:MAG: TVP38/TMEM64 family protein [Firmicutes bacterium]|nr:TVP38/TMEM64 family protein [Bacillota bacterium]